VIPHPEVLLRAATTAAIAAAALLCAAPAHAQMAHPAGMSHGQVVQAASAGGPDFISQNATIGWIDSTGTLNVMRQGTNGFTCVVVIPDPFGGPICGDRNAAAWVIALLTHAAQPPAMSPPGIAYMARGGAHYEDAQGIVLMEHDMSPHAAGSHRVVEQPHWMLMYPFDPAATGFPTKENGTGSYIMFAGTPWAHVMIYQDPNQMNAPARH
jgi:hypothetical protein